MPDEPSHLESCIKCGSMCCTYFCMEIEAPRSKRDFEEIRWYVCHENTKVYRDEGQWHLLVENRCRYLDEEGKCRIYDHRPTVCREYDPEKCEGFGDFDYDVMLDAPEAVDAYMQKRFARKARTTSLKSKRYVPPRHGRKKR